MTQSINIERLRYPIGRYAYPENVSDQVLNGWLNDIENLPADLRSVSKGISEEQLDTPYRPDGWTARQVIHHIGDSHMNSLARFKWALTEDRTTIKPYDENLWAQLEDYRTMPVEDSMELITLIHKKLTILLRSLNKEHLDREFIHPDMGLVQIKWNIGLYAWHGKHHVAHVGLVR